jgi:hypothetical protein
LLGKHKSGRPLGRPRGRWNDNIKMDFWKVGWGQALGRSVSRQGEVAGSCECGNEPSDSVRCGKFLD